MAKKKDSFEDNPLGTGTGEVPAYEHPTMEQVEEALKDTTDAVDPPVEFTPASTPNEVTPNTGIDPMAVMAKLATALENLGARQADGGNTERMETMMAALTTAMERVSQAVVHGATMQTLEAKRAHRPSNEIYHGKSIYDRRGSLLDDYKKPRLKCVMMLPFIAEWEGLTREEVELLNLLEQGEYLVKRVDNSKIKITIKVSYALDNKTPSQLVILHDTAFNNDNGRLFPPITEWVRQVLRQHENRAIGRAALAVLSDEEEEMMIEAGELTVSQ